MPPHAEFQAIKPGAIYCLKQRIDASGNEAVNPLQPYFLVYIRDDGEVRYNFTAPKQMLEIFRAVCQGKTEPYADLCKLFDAETNRRGRYEPLRHVAGQGRCRHRRPVRAKECGQPFCRARRQAHRRGASK